VKIIRRILGLDLPDERSDAGLTIVEVVVAMLVFAVITVGAIAAVGTVLTMTGDSRSREVAANLAAQDVDRARSTPDVFDVQSTTTPVVSQQNGTTFKLTRNVNWVSTSGISSQCGSGGGALLYKQVNTTVTWGSGSSAQSTSTNTLLAPNSKINDPDFGTILVTVQSGVGLGPRSGVSVTITPDASVASNTAVSLAVQPDATDANGCAFALKVTPGSYTVSLSSSGAQYRDQAQSATPSQSVSVGAGGSASAIFAFDPAAVYSMQYASNYAPGGATLPSNLATSFLSNLPQYTATSPGLTQYVSPSQGGYQALAGRYAPATATQSCVDTDPEAWPKGSGNTTGKREPLVSAQPADTQPMNVAMGVIRVTVASNVRFVTVASTSPLADDPGCAIAQTYVYPVIPTVAGTQYQVTLAVPFGTWTVATQTTSGGLSSGVLWTNITPLTTGQTALSLSLNKVMLDPRTK
jgi:Tfp pilus assembly protein PilX